VPTGEKEQYEMADETKQFPAFSTRDRSLPENQIIPLSRRDSGSHLDECCAGPDGEIMQASAGKMGLDAAWKFLKKK
jgi:hypothetical protein